MNVSSSKILTCYLLKREFITDVSKRFLKGITDILKNMQVVIQSRGEVTSSIAFEVILINCRI